jgi:hypothetical protein
MHSGAADQSLGPQCMKNLYPEFEQDDDGSALQ